MSIMAESSVYESMTDDGLTEKLCLAGCPASGPLMFIPKIERNVEEAMRDVSDDGGEEKMAMFHHGIIEDVYGGVQQSDIYYEEAFSACEEVEVDYKPSLGSLMIPSKIEREESNQFDTSAMNSSFKETETAMSSYNVESENVDDSDEETIATFLTSAGQRLALYSVEDSDEVYAVAVYNESGEPPTNFQFLMKADVERLIGEGAVRTVKKPMQMKKQTFDTDPLVFSQRSEESTTEESELKVRTDEGSKYQNNQYNTHNVTTSSYDADISSNDVAEEIEEQSSPLPEADKQPEFTYVLMEDTDTTPDRIEGLSKRKISSTEHDRGEFIEQSTVQYILLGDDDTDDELTLADIEETLKTHRIDDSSNKSLFPKIPIRNVDSPENHHSLNGMLSTNVARDELKNVDISTSSENYTTNSSNFPTKTYKSPSTIRKPATSLICKRENFIDERFSISSGTSLLIANSEVKSSSEAIAPSETVEVRARVKRSRKQQLTSVNRDDSEIIIQPASFPSEEDEPPKKRGRGKRKPGRPAIYKGKAAAAARKAARTQRPRPVEVIEIDVDEEDRLQGTGNIVEITIDENKEKGSSDKENEVIMLGDSDDEAQKAETSKSSTSLLKCNHCLRSFRQKRALKTHSRVCPKSPDSLRRINEKTVRRNSARSNAGAPAVKKQYPCKICQEKFDVVVALARHVRSMHSLKKKINSSGQMTSTTTTTTTTTPEKLIESSVKIDEDTPKKSQSSESAKPGDSRRKIKMKTKASNRSWKSKKLHCIDCGRWFSSDALLTAHCLQHATKKSEKQARRCQTCKKLFKSRLLYIRHMRMHSRAKQLQKKLHHTRQATGKTTAVRRRGRPRKL